MDKPHATPARFGADTSSSSANVARSVAVPLVGAAALVALFFVLLLSSPGTRDGGGAAGGAVEDDAVVTPAASRAAGTVAVPPACEVPQASGQAGVVAKRFAGEPTSSGHRYDPEEPSCIVNAAGALGALEYDTELRVTRRDDAARGAVCRVVGHWNGAKFPDRLVLVSSAVARVLEVGDLGLIEVTTGCPPPTRTASVHAELR